MSNQIKILVGSLVAGVAALALVAGSTSAQDSKQSGCEECCKKMNSSMPRSSSIN